MDAHRRVAPSRFICSRPSSSSCSRRPWEGLAHREADLLAPVVDALPLRRRCRSGRGRRRGPPGSGGRCEARGPSGRARPARSGPRRAAETAAGAAGRASRSRGRGRRRAMGHYRGGESCLRRRRARSRPARAANVAAACRAMKNMGLARLRLVAPPPDLAEPEARALAYGAWDVLDAATRHDSLQEAIGASTLVVRDLRTARPRGLVAAPPGPRGWRSSRRRASEPGVRAGGHRASQRRARPLPSARAHPHRPRPALAEPRPGGPLLAYEIRLAAVRRGATGPEPLASQAEVEAALQELREGLVGIGYLNPQNPDAILAELRRLLARARPSPREVDLLRGLGRQARWAARSIARRRGPSG